MLDKKIENAKQVLDCSLGKAYLSDFWKDLLERRPNFLEKEDLQRFFRCGGTTGYGTVVGDSLEERYGNLERLF